MISTRDEQALVVWTTWPGETDPGAFALALVEAGLAACVTTRAGLTSTYRWQGATETASEQQVTIKTTRSRLQALEARVLELHPYDVPEFLVLPVGGSEGYLRWMTEATKSEEAEHEEAADQ